MKIAPWYLAALAPFAAIGYSGAHLGHAIVVLLTVGIFLGTQIPNSWGLDFTLALTFIAMVIPILKDRPNVAAALSAGIVAVIANPLPYKTGLMLAAITGIAVGLILEKHPTQYAIRNTEAQ